MNKRNCKYCGSTYHSNYKRQVTCGSAECLKAHRTLTWKKVSYDLKCHSCDAEYQGTKRDGKYCPDCVGAAISRARSPENTGIYTAIREGSRQDVLDAVRLRCAITDAGCWEWQGFKAPSGYGCISAGRDKSKPQELTHRLTYEYATGISPAGMTVHHKCANTTCCNPDHLELATQRDNMAEMYARKSYEAQISELRKALALLAPDHPLLRM